ncbi:uncharacterized protein LOC128210453 [Mya arenaria]|uniref:uncharacterized protein LOC128210453 n=1 Tax=Mya arenaria TaxID=6604 RepID=UPI0022E1313D|nr:uncharacterized protein LOC128210453 [Mya arenaria]
MYEDLCFSVCVVFHMYLVAFSAASVLYCNDEKLTWKDAMTSCINSGGTPVGKNIHESSKVQMQNQTYWTSDFITKTVLTSGAALNVTGHLCGYKVFHWPNGFCKEKFANCSFEFKYICCPEGRTPLHECIQAGTWEKALFSCNHTFSEPVFGSGIFNGRYWTKTAVELTLHETPGMHEWLYTVPDIYQCGTIGIEGVFHYTDYCNRTLPSYCSFDRYEENISHMRVCGSPISAFGKTSTKTQSSYMTVPSTSPTIIASKTSQRTTQQSSATRNFFEGT